METSTHSPAAGAPYPQKDYWITLRETGLNTFLRIRPENILNPQSPAEMRHSQIPLNLSRELVTTMNQFKSLAIDSTGAHVNYEALSKSEPYTQFKNVSLPKLRVFDPGTLKSHEQKLAFWINLYNVLIMDAVINYDISKTVTRNLGILRFFRRAAYNIGGMRISADDIEHGILRANQGNPFLPGPQFAPNDPRTSWVLSTLDPRLHFGLNCASRSCPPVGVYDAQQIHGQLDLAAANFIAHETEIIPSENTILLSKIFSWYRKDFGGKEGVLAMVLRYLPDSEFKNWLEKNSNTVQLKYQAYDWGLNKLPVY